jgi:hypothetical protein
MKFVGKLWAMELETETMLLPLFVGLDILLPDKVTK